MHQLIRASAGTGKTWRLSGHFLRQLCEGAGAESILATTFTRKAAGEILGRVLVRLAEAAAEPERCAELAAALAPVQMTPMRASELLQQLTTQLHRMRVSTLDSFFQRVARSLTLELGLPPGWSIVDDYTDMTLRQRAIDAVLAEQDVRDSRQLMQMLAKGRSRRSVRSLIDDAVDGYYELFLQTDWVAWQRIPSAATLPAEEQEICLSALQEIPLSGKRLPKARTDDILQFRAARWIEFISKGIAAAIAAGKAQYGRQDLAPELIDAYEPLVRHARAEILNELSYRNQASWKLIARFHEAYERLRRDTGFSRFNEITRLLAHSGQAMNGQRVNYRLDSSLRHLLLDEFQDTSLDQWNVLRRLIEPLTSTGDDKTSSVFCVGDPKQAIYGWRGGVAEIMDEVSAAVPGIQEETLDESRRSAPAVINTVNEVFTNLHRHQKLAEYGPACVDWEQSFPQHSTFRKDLPGYAELRMAPSFDEETSSAEQTAYLNWVAERVREIHQQNPAAEVAVLMRTNGGVARLVHQLTSLGVPASEEGGTPPTDSPAVLAVMSLLYLSSHPGCTASRYHVARSPLADVVGFHDWRDDAAAMHAATTIRRQLLDSGYGPTLERLSRAVASQCSERDRLRLRQVSAEGWRYDGAPSLNAADFVELLQTSRFSSSGTAPVRVMTIHQSKGLEFDVVVAPELNGSLMMVPAAAAGGPNRAASPEDVCVWVDKHVRHLLPPRVRTAFEQTIADGVRGSLCLLYVTLTRAIHALHLLIPADTRTTRRTLAGILTAALSQDSELKEDSEIWSTGDAFWFQSLPPAQPLLETSGVGTTDAAPQLQLAPMPQGRQRSLTRQAPSDHAPRQLPLHSVSSRDDSGQAGPEGRARGTLMHAWFEQVRWLDEDQLPDVPELREIAHDSDIRQLGIPQDTVERMIQEFLQMLKHDVTVDALSRRSARERFRQQLPSVDAEQMTLRVFPERAFAWRREGRIVQGIIDRLTIVESSGQRLAAEVIDFKTDRLAGRLDDWIDWKKSDYGSQLQDYRAAVAHCFGVPGDRVTTSLLMLDAGVRIDVD